MDNNKRVVEELLGNRGSACDRDAGQPRRGQGAQCPGASRAAAVAIQNQYGSERVNADAGVSYAIQQRQLSFREVYKLGK
jgi:hypothetical protein